MARFILAITVVFTFALSPAHADVFTAAGKGHVPELRAYLDQGGEPNVTDVGGYTPLHYATIGNRAEAVKLLLEHKANVNVAKKDGVTPLHVAAALGWTEIARLLLDAGADPQARDGKGRTPVSLATEKGNREILQLLTAKQQKPSTGIGHSESVRQSPGESSNSSVDPDIATVDGVDLDVTHIGRTPRYYRYDLDYPDGLPRLRAGTENLQRWPRPEESVRYTAHVANRGKRASGSVDFVWSVKGKAVAHGSVPGFAAGERRELCYDCPWDREATISFSVASPADAYDQNNSLTIGAADLTLSIWVERGQYRAFNHATNTRGTLSFEDWIADQIADMNRRLSAARYPVAPLGIRDRLRIEKVVIADELDGGEIMRSDPDLTQIDGRWQFTDADRTNAKGVAGAWQQYVDKFALKPDEGLIHELAHQIGIIDLYRLNLRNSPETNNGIEVLGGNGKVIPVSELPTANWNQTLFRNPGLMAGGDTGPYGPRAFESHTAGGISTNHGHRRGHYGDYLYDTPAQTVLLLVGPDRTPLRNRLVRLYQKSAQDEAIDNTPEIIGTTDDEGRLALGNRPVATTTTVTGHTLRPNPFGQINVVGTNGTMLVRAGPDGEEQWGFLFIVDLNMAYWMGQREQAQITVQLSNPRRGAGH